MMCNTSSMSVRADASDSTERLSGDERRSLLLDVTKDIVIEAGTGAVSMGSVAERAEVTRALVYKHFDNKDALLTELYRREARRLDRHIRRVVESAPDGFEPKLRAFVGAALDAVDEHAPFFAPLRNVGRDRDARQEHRTWDRRTTGYFVSLAVRDFGVDKDTATTVLAVLFSGLQALLSQMRSRPGRGRRQFLEDTYVASTIGALSHLAASRPRTDGTPSR
jgi:AcrR family transcriptional regulator